MIILDTCALIFDALMPQKLSSKAEQSIIAAEENNELFCCTISLWEIAMLIQKKRLHVDTETQSFLDLMLQRRAINVVPISSKIAALSATDSIFDHFDPADRIIAATALSYNAELITCDRNLMKIQKLSVIW